MIFKLYHVYSNACWLEQKVEVFNNSSLIWYEFLRERKNEPTHLKIIYFGYRIARHRREVVEPELIQEKSDSEDERHRKRFGEEEESSEEEEELDEEVQWLCWL